MPEVDLLWGRRAAGSRGPRAGLNVEDFRLDGDSWRSRINGWAMAQREAIERNIWIVQMPMATPPLAPNSVRWIELGLEALDGTGLDNADQFRLLGMLSSHALIDARMGFDLKRSLAGKADAKPVDYPAVLRELVEEQRFPRVHQAVWSGEVDEPAPGRDPFAEFRFDPERRLGSGQMNRSGRTGPEMLSHPYCVWEGVGMTDANPKADLHRYLRTGREALMWKLDGLSEYDVRRPLVPTGTNLLGLLKHVASVEAGYLGDTFGYPFGEPLPWMGDDAEPNADMWATRDESREWVVDLCRRVWAHSDATIDALALDAVGHVPWWPDDRAEVTLHQILVHMIAEIHRHAGHADLVRELIDGAAGLRKDNDNMAPGDQSWWETYRDLLETTAQATSDR